MFRRRLHRLSTAFFVVVSLLFSQLALANYVCPRQADVASMAAMMEAGRPCSGMDLQQPALCHVHATEPGTAFEAVKLPGASLPAVVQVLELPAVVEAVQPVPPAASPELRPPPDPLFLSTLRLRV